MSSSKQRNLCEVMFAILRIRAIAAPSSTGCETSSRSGGLTLLMSSRFGLGPMNETSDITNCSRMGRSEEHTSELQSLMRISYAVFCLQKKNYKSNMISTQQS